MNLELPDALIAPLIEICEELDQRLGNDGCNDFEINDTPEGRELIDLMEADNIHAASVEEARKHPDYQKPHGSNGKLCTQNSSIFGYFRSLLKKAAKP